MWQALWERVDAIGVIPGAVLGILFGGLFAAGVLATGSPLATLGGVLVALVAAWVAITGQPQQKKAKSKTKPEPVSETALPASVLPSADVWPGSALVGPILLLEDRDGRLQKPLGRLACSVHWARSAEEVVECLGEGDVYALVLLDLNDIEQIANTAQRARERGQRTPIVAVASLEHEVRLKKAGVDGCVAKPTEEELVWALVRWVGVKPCTQQGFLGDEVCVPAGWLVSENWEHPQWVEPFAMMAIPVTEAQWRAVMGEQRGKWGSEAPVTEVNWYQALEFCNRASERAGLTPCYAIEGDTARWNPDAVGYRLPTEREWEHACRAGTTTAFSWGDDPTGADAHAWFRDNSGNKPHPAGMKKPNPWGLKDLHGNVWEWCWSPPDTVADTTDPALLTATTSPHRVIRGGSAWGETRLLRSANRFRHWIENQSEYLGFRCVRASRRQSLSA